MKATFKNFTVSAKYLERIYNGDISDLANELTKITHNAE